MRARWRRARAWSPTFAQEVALWWVSTLVAAVAATVAVVVPIAAHRRHP